jgi:hypothetical protein
MCALTNRTEVNQALDEDQTASYGNRLSDEGCRPADEQQKLRRKLNQTLQMENLPYFFFLLFRCCCCCRPSVRSNYSIACRLMEGGEGARAMFSYN